MEIFDQVPSDCDIIIDQVYHTKACQQTMMETMRTGCPLIHMDVEMYLRSTQTVFRCRSGHCNALHIQNQRSFGIGGGFPNKTDSGRRPIRHK